MLVFSTTLITCHFIIRIDKCFPSSPYVSNANCPPGVTDIYDSAPAFSTASYTLQKEIAVMINTYHEEVGHGKWHHWTIYTTYYTSMSSIALLLVQCKRSLSDWSR